MGNIASRYPKEMREAFAVLDVDQDGTVSIKELQDAMLEVYPKYGVKPYEIADLSSLVLRAADDDDSGVISIEEFASNRELQQLVKEKLDQDKAFTANLRKMKKQLKRIGHEDCARIKSLFAQYDADNSGSLDSAELSAISKDLGYECSPHTARLLLNEIDADSSGKIELGEFLDWWPTVERVLNEEMKKMRGSKIKSPAPQPGVAGFM
ncbi:Calmodulin [Diplonema papillatum]|nr:Calmodulin [Diplonema papillatum]